VLLGLAVGIAVGYPLLGTVDGEAVLGSEEGFAEGFEEIGTPVGIAEGRLLLGNTDGNPVLG